MPPQIELYQRTLALEAEIAELKLRITWFERQLFGAKSEKIVLTTPGQVSLGLELPQVAPVQPLEKISYERRKPAPEKRPIPAEVFANLPVLEVVELIPEEVKAEPEAFKRISEERTFEVEIIGPKLVKREFVRPKFQRKADRDEAPVMAPAKPRVIEGGYASAGLVAYIAISKYQHHLPLYRLEAMSEQWGVRLSRKSMAEWIRIAAEWGEPIYKLMVQEARASGYIQCDETPVKVIDPDEKGQGTVQGFLWVMSSPGGDVVFDWRLSRRHGELTTLIGENYQGILQSDGYEAYASYAKTHTHVAWVGCWAHARRKFFEAQAEKPRIAKAVLRLIGRMYVRERDWNEKKIYGEDRKKARQGPEGLARTMKALRRLALWTRERVLPKSAMGKACDYLLGQWGPLSEHLNHGETKLDNNLVENAIRPSCVGKKNWLFIGHPQAGQRSAILYSLIVSCQRRGIDPLAYLKDVLTRLPTMTSRDDLTTLLPRNWQPAK